MNDYIYINKQMSTNIHTHMRNSVGEHLFYLFYKKS